MVWNVLGNASKILNKKTLMLPPLLLVLVLFGVYYDYYMSKVMDNRKAVVVSEPWITEYYKNISKLQSKIPKDLKLFSLTMNESEIGVTMNLLEVFAQVMEKHNLRYVINGGSLLGIYRHHGPIPWDDDLDVLADVDQKDRISKALETLSPEYVLYKKGGFPDDRWKLYSKENSKQGYKVKKWKWPFLDIFWYKDKGTYILDIFRKNKMKSSDFYPLRKRPFGNLSIYAPCNVSAKLTINKIDWNMCVSNNYNHRKEIPVRGNKISVPCQKLYKYFPFVHRFNTEGVTMEYLKAQDTVVSSYKELPCK